MIDINIDARQLERVVVDLAATEVEVRKALNSTLRRMAAWVRTRSARGLSGELAIQQKIVRRRIKSARLQRQGDGASVKVWYGLNPISLIWLNPRQSGAGVKAAGGRFVDSGFIANGKRGGRQVFKRKGKARLPIEKQRAEIEPKAAGFLESRVLKAAEFEAQFFKTFEHELKWRTQTQ
jgi:hypothetical protein